MAIRSHAVNSRRGGVALGASGPVSGAAQPRLQLIVIPPGRRCLPHLHPDAGCTVYLVSGAADLWHGADLATCSPVRAGDVVSIPAGMPHLAVNAGDVTCVAVTARADPADPGDQAVVQLPRHLEALRAYPAAPGE